MPTVLVTSGIPSVSIGACGAQWAALAYGAMVSCISSAKCPHDHLEDIRRLHAKFDLDLLNTLSVHKAHRNGHIRFCKMVWSFVFDTV